MDFPWTFFVDLGIISFGLLAATVIRAFVPFFQRFMIPNALTAGFLLLPFFNFLAPRLGLSEAGLGALVYHLLNLSFISMTLRRSDTKGVKGDGRIFGTSVAVLSQYAIQAVIGLLLTLMFFTFFVKDLFPSFGFLLPLGFALGPGQAYAIGQGWERFGFAGAGTVGLTFAALGFLWACFGGIFLINYGIRRGWMNEEEIRHLNRRGVKRGVFSRGRELPVGSRLTTETEAIDSMSFNLGLVLSVYLLSYLSLHLITWLLSFAGSLGRDLAVNLWGIGFIFCALVALAVKALLKALRVEHTVDNGTMTRISGSAVDIMVAASIAAISLVVVARYLVPIMIMSTLAGLLALVTVPWISSRMFRDHRFHRTMIVFGVSTGTLPTGLALLRVIDPDFETPVASDYMYASGLTFVFAIPFILAINLPAYSRTTGNPLYFWLAVAVSVGYLIFVAISFLIISRRRSFQAMGEIWLRESKAGPAHGAKRGVETGR